MVTLSVVYNVPSFRGSRTLFFIACVRQDESL